MQQDEDQLLIIAREFVEQKVSYASAEQKEEMAIELKGKIDDTIRAELVAEMTPEQIQAYGDMLEGDNVTQDMIVDFIKDSGIDANKVTQVALTKFRIAYLGA